MDTLAVDSIHVNLNDQDQGKWENPCLISNVVVGYHKLFVYTETASGTTKTDIEVREYATTPVWFWLATIGPYVGNTAPLFTAQDIRGDILVLEEEQGKVVLLAFFEHT
jgi:hypothetical protein